MTSPPDPTEQILRHAGLPDDVVARLRDVIDRSGLDVASRADVAHEFVAHFEDGLAAGRPMDELLRGFGEPDTVARLIRQAKGTPPERIMTRESSVGSACGALLRNVRYAFRRLRHNPVFTAIAVLSLAVGIGANTAGFSLVETVVLRSRPYADIDRLVDIYSSSSEIEYSVFSYPEYDVLQRTSGDVFDELLAMRLMMARVEGEGEAQIVGAEIVSGNYFPTLGIHAHLGRLIGPEDDVTPGAHPVIALAYDYWWRMGGDPSVVGATLRVSGRDYTVIGVAPPEYRGSFVGIKPAFFASTMMTPALELTAVNDLESSGNRSYFLRAHLAEGIDVRQATSAASALASRVRTDLDWPPDFAFKIVPTADVIAFPPLDRFVRAAAWLVMAMATVVLLVATANLASFLLARAVDRRREISIRMALGASRSTLLGQLLTETTLLSLMGGALGFVVASIGIRALLAIDLPLPIPLEFDIRFTGRVFAFTAGVSVLTGILFGLAPALHTARSSFSAAMKPDSKPRAGGRLPVRQALVVTQVAVSLVLLVAAGLFVRSLIAIRNVDVGLGYRPAAVVELTLPDDGYDPERGRLFVEQIEGEVARLPGVEAVGVIHRLHLNTLNQSTRSISVEGIEPPPDRDGFDVDYAVVDPGFFDAAGIHIVQGRNFTPPDRPESAAVGIISRAMADHFWPNQNPIGETYREGGEVVRVVGVASDAKVRTIGEAPTPLVYRPLSQRFAPYLTLVASTAGHADQLSRQVVDIIHAFDPSVFIARQTTMERHLAIMQMPVHLAATAAGGFAALALGLAAIGLYGVVSYAVARRTREVGIRISVGARTAQVIQLLMAGGLKLVLIGSAIGLALALVSARILSSLLFGIRALDPMTFVTVPLALMLVAAVAAYVPARRASRIDPVRALKVE